MRIPQGERQMQLFRFPVEPEDPIIPRFGIHQGISPRLNWMVKAYHWVLEDPFVFRRPDEYYVRKLYMMPRHIKSMEFWARAFKLIQAYDDGSDSPTTFANWLLGESGTDPYLETDAIWQWLHWKLFVSPVYVPGYWAIFMRFYDKDFTKSELITTIAEYAKEIAPHYRGKGSFDLEVKAFLDMYCLDEDKSKNFEFVVDHPFHELRLFTEGDKTMQGERQYHWSIGYRDRMNWALILAMCLDYAYTRSPQDRRIRVNDCLYGDGAPGRVFKFPIRQVEEAPDLGHPQITATVDGSFQAVLLWEGNTEILIRDLLEFAFNHPASKKWDKL